MSFIKNYAIYKNIEEAIKTTTATEDFKERIDEKSAENLLPEDVRAKLKLVDDVVIIRRKDLNKIVTDMWGE